MDESDDIHGTSRSWYQVKIAKGETPETLRGGELDGLLYFLVNVDGVDYWLTDVGLFTPPDDPASSD